MYRLTNFEGVAGQIEGNMTIYTLRLTNDYTHTYTSKDVEVEYRDFGVYIKRDSKSVFYPYANIVYITVEEEKEGG